MEYMYFREFLEAILCLPLRHLACDRPELFGCLCFWFLLPVYWSQVCLLEWCLVLDLHDHVSNDEACTGKKEVTYNQGTEVYIMSVIIDNSANYLKCRSKWHILSTHINSGQFISLCRGSSHDRLADLRQDTVDKGWLSGIASSHTNNVDGLDTCWNFCCGHFVICVIKELLNGL